jgi:type III pantothenate kinase
MLIAIDIGNSNIVVGVYRHQAWEYIWRLPTERDGNVNAFKLDLVRLLHEAGIKIGKDANVVISSVVPELTDPFRAFCADLFTNRPLVIGPGLYSSLDFKLRRPYEIGSDLVANAYAAVSLYERNALVIDFGTALTFTAVSVEREIIAVSIAPGIQTAIKSLRAETAQLPEVPLEFPKSVGGSNTVEAIQSGVLQGYEGMIEHMMTLYKEQYGQLYKVATGGLVSVLSPLHGHFDQVEPLLTLQGMRLIHERSG